MDSFTFNMMLLTLAVALWIGGVTAWILNKPKDKDQ